jgi:hypothetical protein
MKKTLIITTLILVLGLSMVVKGQKDAGGWEYAKFHVSPMDAKECVWKEPNAYAESENLTDLCWQLKIDVPSGEKPELHTIINWAGSNGWELVLVTNQELVNFTSFWFKRKS